MSLRTLPVSVRTPILLVLAGLTPSLPRRTRSFSAAKSDGAVRGLLKLLSDAGHECWADGFVAEEARRNIAMKAAQSVSDFEALLADLNLAKADPAQQVPEAAHVLPDKDRPVLAAAIRLKCEALLTGDRTYFGPLYGRNMAGVRIHSPRSIAEALLR